MKFRITKEEFDKLSPEMKLLYIVDGDGYRAAIEGYEDPVELKRAKQHEVDQRKALQAKITELESKLEALTVDPARKAGDIATLEKSWKDKLTARETELQGHIDKLRSGYEGMLLDNATNGVAAAITATSQNAALIGLHVRQRLSVTYDGDVPTVRVKDAEGKISAMSLSDLQNEFAKNPLYGAVVVTSKASGSGGSGHTSTSVGGGAGTGGKKFSEMTGTERTALFRENRAEFDRLNAEHKAAMNERRFGPAKVFSVAGMTPVAVK